MRIGTTTGCWSSAGLPGVSLERARAEMDLLAAELVARYPKENEHVGANVFRLRDELSTQSRMLL